MVLRFFLFVAAFLIVSCTEVKFENPDDPDSNYHGETVVIGNQTWLKKNLNYAVSGSVCYENDPANCAKYGRLYNWETAKSICPSGFHLPTKDEWNALVNFVENNEGGAGKHLKSKSGWNESCNESGNGLDSYGFSALPGGFNGPIGAGYGYDDYFASIGYVGRWWSASEDSAGIYAYHWDMNYCNEDIFYGYNHKFYFFSVRCLKNDTKPISSSVSSSSTATQSNITYGDPVFYNDDTYKTVVIGTQTWMARNLNYAAEGSKCIDNLESNCTIYGRLYDWKTAMALPDSCNNYSCASEISQKHQGICPNGWHIPSNADWNILMKFVNLNCSDNSNYCVNAGRYLKATSGWSYSGNGEDKYGFSALPGGYGELYGGFYGVGDIGIWWSATEGDNGDYAFSRGMNSSPEGVRYYYDDKPRLYSVRCLLD